MDTTTTKHKVRTKSDREHESFTIRALIAEIEEGPSDFQVQSSLLLDAGHPAVVVTYDPLLTLDIEESGTYLVSVRKISNAVQDRFVTTRESSLPLEKAIGDSNG